MADRTDSNADLRGEARLIDTVLAVQLAVAARDLNHDPRRLISMIAWILERETNLEPNGNLPVRLFIAAIKASEPEEQSVVGRSDR